MKSYLANFLDTSSCVKQWPAKRAAQLEVIEYIAGKFATGTKYSEAELNEVIKIWHTFGDWAIIRREMCDSGYFDRDKNSTVYFRTAKG